MLSWEQRHKKVEGAQNAPDISDSLPANSFTQERERPEFLAEQRNERRRSRVPRELQQQDRLSLR
jgi:hypothetical protein